MRQPDVHVRRAIGLGAVVVAVQAVDVRRQRATGRIDFAVLLSGRRRPGHQVDQRLVVPVLLQRQLRDCLGLDLGVRVRLVGLQQLGLRLHGDGFAQLPDFEVRINTADCVDVTGTAVSTDSLKPCSDTFTSYVPACTFVKL